jgi:hypothetical protein
MAKLTLFKKWAKQGNTSPCQGTKYKKAYCGSRSSIRKCGGNIYDGMCGTRIARSSWTLNRYGLTNEQKSSHFCRERSQSQY